MDLRFPDAEPTADEIAALDAVLGAARTGDEWERHLGGIHQAEARRHELLGALHTLQDRVGFISEGGLGELCRRLDVPPSEAYGVASFYDRFALESVPPHTIQVCGDLACAMAGLPDLGPARPDARVEFSSCLGLCERAPAALVTRAGVTVRERVVAPASAANVDAEPDEPAPSAAVPQAGDPGLALLRRVGKVDPTALEDHRREGGYEGLLRALHLGPAATIEEITASKLVGRGGAAFPAGRKWAAVAAQPARPHYVVCNADESEPGTFKDRVLLENDPFAVIEAMTIAGFAVGAGQGYVYLRGEYPRARHTLQAAIDDARHNGALGPDVLGAGFAFDIEIVRGAGAYICGEETAIFNSIEGYRGEPRSKPPFPVEVGLFGQPTLVNNVETLANVPLILAGGATAYAAIGTEGSTGTKLFCLSGAVARPGVYEVPFGATLGDLLTMAGGVAGGRGLQAVLLGGAAGSFVGPDKLTMSLTFEGARAAGASLGSGVIMVIDDATPLAPLLRRIASFFRHESCGQCVPCRVGTVRQEEAITRLTLGPRRDGDLELLREIGQVMRDSSICGLGQTAWTAIESAIDTLGALR